MEESAYLNSRKHYIDNLRNIIILLLFYKHTFMIWNDFGSKFYVWMGANKILSTLVALIDPWFMPILFVFAGMSARYAMKKRTIKEFIKQRISKLLIPFVGGMIFLVPFQSLYARKFFDNYDGSLLEHWKYFFTNLTDFMGYDGAFTPGHLWFILFLFVISMIALVLFYFIPYEKIKFQISQVSFFYILILFIPIWLMYYLGNFGGFSLGKNFALYIIGYYILSNNTILNMLEDKAKLLIAIFIVCTVISVSLYYKISYFGDLWVNLVGWISILALLVLGKKYLNKKTKFTEYFNEASYPIYILHQSILIALAYYVVKMTDLFILQVCYICIGSFLITMCAYHLFKFIPGIRKIIGIT